MLTGSIIHSFMEYIGQTDKTATYSSIILIFQCSTMVFCSFWGDRIKKTTITLSFSIAIISLIAIPLILSTANIPQDNAMKYAYILAFSCISSMGLGIYNIMCYKLPLEIYKISNYGKLCSICGIVSGLASFGLTSLLSFLLKNTELGYRIVFAIFFSFGLILYIICSIITITFKPLYAPKETPKKSSIKELLKEGKFTKLIIPNFLRGVGTSIIALTTVIGLKDGILDATTSTYIAVFTVLGALIGNIAYLLVKKFSSLKIIITTSILMFILFPLMVITKNIYIFFACYLLGWALNTIYGIAIPVSVYDNISSKIIGGYSAWRMLIFTSGHIIIGFFLNALLEHCGSFIVLLIGASCLLICGLSYVLVFRKRVNDSLPPTTNSDLNN